MVKRPDWAMKSWTALTINHLMSYEGPSGEIINQGSPCVYNIRMWKDRIRSLKIL